MTVMDPIADMFTRIRNSLGQLHEYVNIRHSKMKLEIIKILVNEGYINGYEIANKDIVKKQLKVQLKYDEKNKPLISSIKKLSKSGGRINIKKEDIPKVLNGFGISILSTSKGILSGKEARINNVGGELLAEIY